MNSSLLNPRWLRTIISDLALLAVSATAFAGLKVGDPLPDLSAFKLEGKIPDALKGKVVLLDFWASWCVPCAESFPVMEELHGRYKDAGLVIVAVNVDDQAGKMERFLKKRPVTFAVVRDASQKLVSAVEPATMPTSFLLDRSGKVRFLHKGYHGDETRKEYMKEIESLLNEKP